MSDVRRGIRKGGVVQGAGATHSISLHEPAGQPSPVINPHPTEIDGRQIGRYEVVGEITRGSKSVILKAQDTDLGREVAMKLLKRELIHDTNAVQRFVEESQVGAQLQHPGIIPVYELGITDDNRPYFTMKYVHGETFAILLGMRKNPAEDRRRFLGIFEKVCHAVAYAHVRGVVHRDLRPWNIMVGTYGDVVVMDWGYARVGSQGATPAMTKKANEGQISIIQSIRANPDESDLDGVVIGTPGYMSPEQAAGEIDLLDERSDVFALGAILTEILTGAAPYQGDRLPEMLELARRADQTSALKRLKKCDADRQLVALAVECLTPARQARPRNADEVASRLGKILTQMEVDARQAQLAAEAENVRAQGAVKARRLTFAIAGAVLVSLLLGAGLFFWLDRSAREGRAEANRKVLAALQTAVDRRKEAEAGSAADAERWTAALASASAAKSLADESPVTADIRDRAARLLSEVTGAEAADRAAIAARAREERLLASLTDIRSSGWEDPPPPNRGARYLAAFREAGLDFAGETADQITRKVRQFNAAGEIVGALDDWARVVPDESGLSATNYPYLVLRLLDPDDRRAQIRSVVVGSPSARRRGALLALGSQLGGDLPFETNFLLGCTLLRSRAPEAAIPPLRAAVEASPRDFWSQFQLAAASLSRASPALTEAVGRFTTAAALRPAALEARHGLATALLRRGQIAEATAIFKVLLQQEPSNGHYTAHLAEAYLAGADPASGLRMLENAAASRPDDPWVRSRLGESLLDRGEWTRAAHEFSAAMQAAPDWRTPVRGWIEALAGAGALEQGRDDLAASAQARQDAQSLVLLGEAQTRLGEVEAAIATLEKAVVVDPGDAEALYSLGVAQIASGREREAIESFKEAVATRPGYPAARRRLALAGAAVGDTDSALRSLLTAVTESPDDVGALCDVGYIRIRRGDALDALDTFESAAKLAPKAASPVLGAATALNRLGRAVAASERLRALVARSPQDLGALRLLHDTLAADGRIGLEVRILTQERNRNPEDPAASLALASAQLAAGHPDNAVEAAMDTARFEGWQATANLLRAIALDRLGKSAAAEEAFEQTLAFDPDQPEAWCRLGRLLLQTGRFQAASRDLSVGHGMGTADTAWNLPSGQWLEEARRMLALEPKLPEVLSGRTQGENAAETLTFGRALARKGEPALAARLFRRAWELRSGTFPEPSDESAFLAAQAVARAAFGPSEAEEWQRAVLAWLGQGALSVISRKRSGDRDAGNTLLDWLSNPSLAPFRESGSLRLMPEDLSKGFGELWQRVRAEALPASPDGGAK